MHSSRYADLQQPVPDRRLLTVRELPVTSEPRCRRHDALLRFPDGLHYAHHDMYFELEGERLPPPPDRLDYLVLALLFFAMRHDTDLHVEGAVSGALLDNLEEFQRAWAMWRPDSYRPVRITAAQELETSAPRPGRRAVVPISGGVDGTFSLLQHCGVQQARDRRQLVSAMLIHGFDVPLAAEGAFGILREHAEATAAFAGLPLTVVKTDWRNFSLDWEDDFASGLAACLHLFSGGAEYGLMSAGADYTRLVFPMGENPITNSMMSSDHFQIQMVGYSAGRTSKVAAIASADDLASHLRVCWEGPVTGRNCGHCEKCVRTKLNFLAAGARPPDVLGAVPGPRDVLALRAKTLSSIRMLLDIREAGRAGSLSPTIKWALEICLAKNWLLLGLRGLRRALRRVFRIIVSKTVRSDQCPLSPNPSD